MDWDDERCRLVLRRCKEAMPPNARLLIVERVMPVRLSDSPHDQAIARGTLNMLVAQDGQERTLAQYRELLADAGLRMLEPVRLSVGFDVLAAVK